jgi:diphosphomevalonate decarboxylase
LKHIDRIRKKADLNQKVKIVTKNNFSKGTGIASSASGFSALTVAASKAAGLDLSKKKLSILARLGSGSACRSIPGGIVEWQAGNNNETSYAYSLYPIDYWNICDLVIIVSKKEKRIGSTKGHSMAEESPFLQSRIDFLNKRIKIVKRALKEKDFTVFGKNIEAEALNMHAVMMTSNPPIVYWLPKTLEIMLAVQQWRAQNLESYFTIDAGPIVHLICQKKDVDKIKAKLSNIEGIKDLIINYPANGAVLTDNHLF